MIDQESMQINHWYPLFIIVVKIIFISYRVKIPIIHFQFLIIAIFIPSGVMSGLV